MRKAAGRRRSRGTGAYASPNVPRGMEIVGAVVDAFDATKDAPEDAKCVLRSKTMRRGFRGECATGHWCCAVSALLAFLLEHELVSVPGAVKWDRGHTRSLLFVSLAAELICWEEIRRTTRPPDVRAHFRYLVASAAHRVGMFLGAAGRGIPTPLQWDRDWSDPTRRSEPLRRLMQQCGYATQKEFATKFGCDEDTVTRWMAGRRPRADAFDAFDDLGTRLAIGDRTGRDLRWHYALAEVADRLSVRFDRETICEAATVFASVARCVAARMAGAVSARAFDAKAMVIGALRTPHVFEAQHWADHAARHGASAEFVADVRDAGATWASVVAAANASGELPELRLLVEHLPEKKTNASGGRAGRRTMV